VDPVIPTAAHPDDNALAAFMAGELRGGEARAIEVHMDRCDECRTVLAELVRITPASDGRTRTDTRAGHDSTLPSGEQASDHALGELLAERFCLVRPLGQGGMGRVYEADDLTLGIRVALKLLPKGLASNGTYLAHLHQEIRLGRRVSHPNVCRIYDLGTWRGDHFLTMELVEGETLAERLMRGALDPALGRQVARQVVAAMAAAHKENVIHRDLKPGNIMIDGKGHVKVMDFGLARDQKSAPSGRFGPVGTPGYWSPEQARGETTGTASDVYALGLVLYEILAFEPVHPMRRRGLPGLARRYRPLVTRCLEKLPSARFADAAEVQVELERVLARRRRALTRTLAIAPGVAGVAVAAVLAILGSQETTPSVAASPAPVQVNAAPAPIVIPQPVMPPPNGPLSNIEPAAVEATPRPHRRARSPSRVAPAAAAPEVSEPTAPPSAQPAATPPTPAPDAASVQRKLDRLTGESRAKTLSPESARAVKGLFAEVHAAYFRDDFARADELLDRIARQLEK
jgi:hypothetical protein